MNRIEVTLYESPERMDYLERILMKEEAILEFEGARVKSCDPIVTLTAAFTDEIEADIKVCNGDGPYVDAVLFHDGHEVQVLEPSDSLRDEFEFVYEDTTYVVRVTDE